MGIFPHYSKVLLSRMSGTKKDRPKGPVLIMELCDGQLFTESSIEYVVRIQEIFRSMDIVCIVFSSNSCAVY